MNKFILVHEVPNMRVETDKKRLLLNVDEIVSVKEENKTEIKLKNGTTHRVEETFDSFLYQQQADEQVEDIPLDYSINPEYLS